MKITFFSGILVGEDDVGHDGTVPPADDLGLTDVRVLDHGIVLDPWLLGSNTGFGLFDDGIVLDLDDGDVVLNHHLRGTGGADSDLGHGQARRVNCK